ncbi:306_t:CDS:2 [Diversispora eburnea]|uniref:306_t:CDS:1 n=1 Tax=Diversispora eburnea TaxID=1213867 RepID=A0A9N9F5B5_9GLOM|nr:306_t:CDS:2 [Diversispora eburnea]
MNNQSLAYSHEVTDPQTMNYDKAIESSSKMPIVQALRTGAMTMDTYLNNKAALHKRTQEELEQDERDEIEIEIDDPIVENETIETIVNEVVESNETKPTNSHTKPPYTYSSLIGQAILQSPNKKLALCEIYSWISKTYPFFKKENKGWQNSIRHNLSLCPAFQKTERDDNMGPNKGQFWTIPEEFESCFINGVYRNIKKTLHSSGHNSSSTKFSTTQI